MENSIFVGRENEINLLKSIYNEADKGLGKLVFIQGNPGIGKSGLVREFFRQIETIGNPVCAVSECNDKEGLNSYAPFKDLLLKLNTANVADSKEKKAQTQSKLKKFLSEAGTQWIGLIPVVGDFAQAGIETYKAYQASFGEKKEGSLQSEDDIYRIFENEFRRLASNRTVVIFLDDLQWADASSLNLIFMLAKSIRENPFRIMIIGTYRQFDIEAGRFKISEKGENIKVRHPLADKLNELRNYTKLESHIKRLDQWFYEISMQPFNSNDVENLVKAKFPKNNFRQSFYSDIFKLTDGHPLYLVEILDYLVKNGNIKIQADGSYSIDQINLSELPVSVQAIINEKVERLNDELKKILSYASVSGEKFAVQEIEKVLKIDELDLLDYLEELSKKHGLLSANEPVHVKNMLFELYRFTQTLVHRYIYENLDGARRRTLHRKMAEIMQNLYGDEIEKNKEIKDKFNLHNQIGQGLIDGLTLQLTDLKAQTSEQESPAFDSLTKAAQTEIVAANECFQQYAANECLDRVNKALAFLSGIKEKNAVTEGLRFDAFAIRNKAQQWQGHYNEAYITAHEMLKLAVYLNNNQHIALSNKALGNAVHFIGRYDEAIVYYNKALELYKSQGIVEMIIDCLNDIARTKESQNLYDQAIHCLQESLEYNKTGDESKTGEILYLLAANHRKRGEHETASKYYLQALTIFEKIGDTKQIGLTYNNMGLNFQATGELQKAMDYIRKALAIAEQQNDRINISNRLNNIGLTYEIMGNTDGALEYYNKTLEIDSSLDDKPKMAITYNNIGMVYANINQFEKANEYFNKSLEIYQSINDNAGLSFTYSSMGHAMYNNGKFEDAVVYLEKSLKIDQENDDKVSMATNYNGLGNTYYNWGKYEKATEYYQKALNIYTKLEDKLSIALLNNNLGGVAYSNQENEKALEHYQYALKFYQSTDDEMNIAMLNGNIANTFNRLKYYDEAISAHQNAAIVYKKLQRVWDYAKQIQGIGLCHYNLGQYNKCIDSLKESNQIFKTMNDRLQLAYNYRDLADAHKNLGDIDKADENYHLAINEFIAAEDDYQAAQTWINLAWLFENEMDREQAIPCYAEALGIMMQLNEIEQVADINIRLGFCYKTIEKLKKSEKCYVEALEYANQIQNPWYFAKAKKGLAGIRYAKNEFNEAKELLLESLELHNQFDDKFELADTYYELANCIWISADFSEQREETISYFNKANDLFMNEGDYYNSAYCMYSLGSVYLELGQNKTAMNYLLKAKEHMYQYDPDYDIDFINQQIERAKDNLPPNSGRPGAI